MSGEEDEKELELKDLIVQTLEANGLLAKLKAQLRASVFMALEDNEKDNQKNNDFQNLKVVKLLTTKEGRMATSLLRDYLECCNLDYTLSVFDPELNSNVFLDKREDLTRNLFIQDTSKDIPILVELLKSQQFTSSSSKQKQTPREDELTPNIIEKIKLKFEKFDTGKKGVLDREKIKSLFLNLFSNFNKNWIEKFVLDEIESNSKDYKNGADFEHCLGLYKKFFNLCLGVVNHSNILTENGFEDQSNKFGHITSRTSSSYSSKSDLVEQLNKSNEKNDLRDSNDDSVSSSSSSMSGFKRSDKSKDSKSNKQNKVNNEKKISFLDENLENLGVETLKPTKSSQNNNTTKIPTVFDNDDLFGSDLKKNENLANGNKSANKSSLSSLGDLPPLNNNGNFQNKFFNLSKDFDKKFKDDDENYDDDFTNGTTPRTPKQEKKLTKNRGAIGSDDEIEDNLSYVEESSKFDEVTVDRSISTIQGNNDADYIEDVSI